MRHAMLLGLAFASLAAASSSAYSADDAALAGSWRLVAVQGLPVMPGGTLEFADGHISGSTGCNRFRASFTVQNGTIKVAPVAATKMYCQDRALVERAYLAALETVVTYELKETSLMMHYQPGDAMLELAR